jgi:hypothetical protein
MNTNHTPILLRQHAKTYMAVGHAASPPATGATLCLASQRLRGYSPTP